MKKSYNKAFTLVELLAVIVILAIILVIAVPKIMDVINSSKKSTLETSVKMIASSAEKTKMQNTVLGKENEEITCSSVAKLSSNDYDLDNCTITFDKNNNASVTIKGKGKFEGLNVCGGTKNEATAQTGACATPKEYFTYDLYPVNISDIVIEDVNKCAEYFHGQYCSTDIKESRCETIKTDILPNNYSSVGLKLNDNAILGAVITQYNGEGESEIIIPDTIDGYTVIGVRIEPKNLIGINKIELPTTIIDAYTYDYYQCGSSLCIEAVEPPEGCPPPH